ncbi:NAD(P)-dependent oxidoreductase [Paenibacillus sp. 1011MAR3C5]|uniref:NAD-dependent epimerase/dehydratase family protein n=1 Tax=Paenibacillus sp. 1011MAR3C5 TaxID=1675787 RepID=UPI000E6D46F2|nr:NAD(P)-dependent oxidoreductase [Paenibacillus sp. 1011MAR3C5]RJE85648.1 NAD(P)-dependent oxidoreductase [Paenibacillus sp. 1011MAR3C5]
MRKILITGKTGFIGRNIYPILNEKYDVSAPSRQELNLLDSNSVYEYLKSGKFDAILHLANPNPVKNPENDIESNMLKDSLTGFLNLSRHQDLYGKMIYSGSGAEFDKTLDISSIQETEFGRSIPKDVYGFGKYIMNEMALKSQNIINMRIFACYGPTDHYSKFITHCINCCDNKEPITIRQDCYFDYMHVFDVAKIAEFFIDSPLNYHDYNCCSGTRYTLFQIAEEVRKQTNSQNEITFLSDGFNKEYTASNDRLKTEYRKELDLISLEKGIQMQIEWQRSHRDEKSR